MSQLHEAGPLRLVEGAAPSSAPGAEVDATEALLHLLAGGKDDVRGMAGALGWTLGELGRWMIDHAHAGTVEGLLRLEDARAQLTLGRYRVAAATVLLRMASDDKGGEAVRKACVDLLTISTVPAAARSRMLSGGDGESCAGASLANAPSPAAPPSEQEILRALQELGDQQLA